MIRIVLTKQKERLYCHELTGMVICLLMPISHQQFNKGK